jgi:hypothetical protein
MVLKTRVKEWNGAGFADDFMEESLFTLARYPHRKQRGILRTTPVD